MRVIEDRYTRERQQIETALRFIQHEARTHTIRQWTGLTDDRIRKLYRSYQQDTGQLALVRHRGKSPHQAAWFMRTSRLRHESAVFASVCCMVGLLPAIAAASGSARVDCVRGQQLCQAYEMYTGMVGTPLISFEYAVLLYKALCRNLEIRTAHCAGCGALVVADQLSLREPRCLGCANC